METARMDSQRKSALSQGSRAEPMRGGDATTIAGADAGPFRTWFADWAAVEQRGSALISGTALSYGA